MALDARKAVFEVAGTDGEMGHAMFCTAVRHVFKAVFGEGGNGARAALQHGLRRLKRQLVRQPHMANSSSTGTSNSFARGQVIDLIVVALIMFVWGIFRGTTKLAQPPRLHFWPLRPSSVLVAWRSQIVLRIHWTLDRAKQ